MSTEPIPLPATGVAKHEVISWFVETRPKLCLLPWLNIHTNPDGKIKLCCNVHIDHFVHKHQKDENDNLINFNLGYDNIDDIWKSRYMRSSRVAHHVNRGSGECQGCDSLEETTGHSPRVGQNKLWEARSKEDTPIQEYLVEQLTGDIAHSHPTMLPISLELRLGNQCNLQCITCWGMSSSLIHDERKEIIGSGVLDSKEMIWLKNKWTDDEHIVDRTDLKEWFDTDVFYSNFKKMAPTLRRLYTTGGEPTLIKSNYKMFQMLIDAGNTDCRIEFTSNMTTWNPEFYKRVAQFKNVEIQMSIDGVDEVGEYIRYPSDFGKVRENIFKAAELVSTRPGWTVKCFTVLQALNLQHIGPIWDLLKEACDQYSINIDWWPITLSHPEYLSLKAVPYDIRHLAGAELGDKRNEYIEDTSSFYIGHHTWDTLRDALENANYDAELNSKLGQFIKLNDEIRQSDGELIFSELIKQYHE